MAYATKLTLIHPEEQDDLYGAVVLATFDAKKGEDFLFSFGDGDKLAVEAGEFESEPSGSIALYIDHFDGQVWHGSKAKADALQAWDRVRSLLKSKEIFEARVVAANDAGLIVDIGVRAFMPQSQVDIHRVSDLSEFVGQTYPMRVISIKERDLGVVVSRRSVLEDEREGRAKEIMAELEIGATFEGIVRTVMPYGVFVDIGGVEGLVHKSQLSWNRNDQPGDICAPGDSMKVQVLDFDPGSDRIGLGRKQLLEDPWAAAVEGLEIGAKITGKVTHFARFGAFLEIAPGVEGLVHNSEIAWGQSKPAKDIWSEGDEVTVEIVQIDLEGRRIGLSARALEPNPWQALAEKHTEGETITVKVVRLADFGAFCELAPGCDGLLHLSDVSWTERVQSSDHFEVGQELEVKLLSIDQDRGRASLGIKQLSQDPFEAALEIAVLGTKIPVTIERTTDFGAFAQIVPGTSGLIHISELREERVDDAAAVVKPGQEVEALVISVDAKKRRIGLSLKRDELLPDEGGETDTYEQEEESSVTIGDLFAAEARGE